MRTNLVKYIQIIISVVFISIQCEVQSSSLKCPTLLNVTGSKAVPTISRINGGRNSSLSFLAAIISPDGKLCSGTLISSKWILTAAHCNVTTSWHVHLPLQKRKKIIEVKSHEISRMNSTEKYWGDISLIQLESEKVGNNIYAKISKRSNVSAKQIVRVGGYGKPKDVMGRIVDMYIQKFEMCKKVMENVTLNEKKQICAGYEHCEKENRKKCVKCKACTGDSGGPLLEWNVNKGWNVIGIASLGIGCEDDAAVGIYVKVGMYYEWIKKITKAEDKKESELKNVTVKEKGTVELKTMLMLVGMVGVILMTVGVILILILRWQEKRLREKMLLQVDVFNE